jgi:hypothetical protein
VQKLVSTTGQYEKMAYGSDIGEVSWRKNCGPQMYLLKCRKIYIHFLTNLALYTRENGYQRLRFTETL